MPANERQQIAASGSPSAGNVQLRLLPRPHGTIQPNETTGNVPFNASAATVKAALDALTWLEPGDTIVTGGPLPGTPIVVEFTGKYAWQDLPPLEVVGTFTGGGAVVTTLQAGSGPAGGRVPSRFQGGRWQRIRANGSRVGGAPVRADPRSRRR